MSILRDDDERGPGDGRNSRAGYDLHDAMEPQPFVDDRGRTRWRRRLGAYEGELFLRPSRRWGTSVLVRLDRGAESIRLEPALVALMQVQRSLVAVLNQTPVSKPYDPVFQGGEAFLFSLMGATGNYRVEQRPDGGCELWQIEDSEPRPKPKPAEPLPKQPARRPLLRRPTRHSGSGQ